MVIGALAAGYAADAANDPSPHPYTANCRNT